MWAFAPALHKALHCFAMVPSRVQQINVSMGNQTLLQSLVNNISHARETGSKIRRNRILKVEDTSVLCKIMVRVHFSFCSSLVHPLPGLFIRELLSSCQHHGVGPGALWERERETPLSCSGIETIVQKVMESLEPDLLSWYIKSLKKSVFLLLVLKILDLFPVSPEKGTKYNMLLHLCPLLPLEDEPGILLAVFPGT